jgi:dihydroorotase
MKLLVLLAAPLLALAQDYDLLLQGGHVIDPKNNIDAVRDVGIKDGRIAAVAVKLDAAHAAKTIRAAGLLVTPGLIDIHTHVYAGTGERGSYAGDNSVYPDGFTLRAGVTTIADADSSGWRNFEDFKDRIIDRSRTRVLAFLNIVGHGMRGGKYEQDLTDMRAEPAVNMARKHKGTIVGFKSAHFDGPEWLPYEQLAEAGKSAGLPVMVDFGGALRNKRPIADLFARYLRPGDIYTHVYSGLRGEQDEAGGPARGLVEGRKRGVIFDVGHGGGSFVWRVAVPLMKAGFAPDSISTDLHIGSMNAAMKDMVHVMSKFLAMGMPLEGVIRRSTWNPAREIGREDLGHLTVGAPADIAVLRLEKGSFGYLDMHNARLRGTERLRCELTVREGRILYDLDALSGEDWERLPRNYGSRKQ